MNLIRLAIDRPIAVVAAILMVVMFGLVALQTIPIQLTPDVRKPVLTVETFWPGAAPAEVEREIITQQEEVFKGLEGLNRMIGSADDGVGEIELEFAVGTDMDRSLVLVANRLDRVPDKPNDAAEPVISSAGSEDQPIAWFILSRKPGNERSIHTYGDFVEDVIQERLERVQGVARVNMFGGTKRELRITVDPDRMARYGLTVTEIADALRRSNASISAGDVEEGKRRYVVRTDGELNTPERVAGVVLRSESDPLSGRLGRVTMGDIATVSYRHKDPVARIRQLGEPALAVNAVRETGANVIETMARVKEAVAELNARGDPASRARFRTGLRRDCLHQFRDRSGTAEHFRGRRAGGADPAAVFALVLRDPDRFDRDPGLGRGLVRGDGASRALDQRDLARGPRLRRRHGGGCGDRGAGEHLQAEAERLRAVAGRLPRRAAGLGRGVRLGRDHRAGLRADSGDGAGGRPAVPRHRRRDLGLGRPVADRGEHRHSLAREPNPRAQTQEGSRRLRVSCRHGRSALPASPAHRR